MPVDSVTIEPYRHGGFVVYQWGTYEKCSVLAGQPFRQHVKVFDTLEEAKAAYPDAEVLDHMTSKPEAHVPSCPPPDFDELDAGERWDEDY